MKVLIGTLYHGEPQFKKCCDAILNQDYKNITHKVIAFKDNLTAHYILYDSFFNESNQFDLMIKIDADMVLVDDHVVSRLIQPFIFDDVLDQYNVMVDDYFTNSLIYGIEVFRKGLNFTKRTDFFVDRCISGQRRILNDYGGFGPAARHCYHPDIKQSYTFGAHRAAKGQEDIIQLVLNHFLFNQDKMLRAACLGALDVLTNRIKVNPKDYKSIAEKLIERRLRCNPNDLVTKNLSSVLKRKALKRKIKAFIFRIISKGLEVI